MKHQFDFDADLGEPENGVPWSEEELFTRGVDQAIYEIAEEHDCTGEGTDWRHLYDWLTALARHIAEHKFPPGALRVIK